jgi:hypothetical protein
MENILKLFWGLAAACFYSVAKFSFWKKILKHLKKKHKMTP